MKIRYDTLTWYLDSDGDGFGDSASTTQACCLLDTAQNDCNDDETIILEPILCDTTNNCDDQIMKAFCGCPDVVFDDDQDGFEMRGESMACVAPLGHVGMRQL